MCIKHEHLRNRQLECACPRIRRYATTQGRGAGTTKHNKAHTHTPHAHAAAFCVLTFHTIVWCGGDRGVVSHRTHSHESRDGLPYLRRSTHPKQCKDAVFRCSLSTALLLLFLLPVDSLRCFVATRQPDHTVSVSQLSISNTVRYTTPLCVSWGS
jgi:hypothetical protein